MKNIIRGFLFGFVIGGLFGYAIRELEGDKKCPCCVKDDDDDDIEFEDDDL